MQLCTRCKKRPAVVFVTKMENNETHNEGLCLNCAKELGLPVDNILKNMGVSMEKSLRFLATPGSSPFTVFT